MDKLYNKLINADGDASGAEGEWATKRNFYMLWLEFLRLSPSYELARRYRMGELQDEALPADFDTVLAVYDDLGDVRHIGFQDWWRERGLRVFGYIGQRPDMKRIDTLSNKRYRKASERVQAYIDTEWTRQGQPNAMLVSIPLGLSKSQISRRLNKFVERYSDQFRVLPEPVAKYPMKTKRLRPYALFRYMFVVWVRCFKPRIPLWRLGVIAKVSETYSPELEGMGRVPRGEKVYDRAVLAAITSRALSRGFALAENAARGKFPEYGMPEHGLKPDIHELCKRIRDKIQRDKKAKREADKAKRAAQEAAAAAQQESATETSA